MTDLTNRLAASIRCDVINGNTLEKAVFLRQVGEAVQELTRQQAEIERLRAENATLRDYACTPDPRDLSGWDDPGCPAYVAKELIELAKLQDIEPPQHLLEAAKGGG